MIKKTRVASMSISMPTFSGGQTMAFKILREIDKDKFEIEVIQQQKSIFVDKANEIGIKTNLIPMNLSYIRLQKNYGIKMIIRKTFRILYLLFNSMKVSKFIVKNNFDLVWCENFPSLLLVSLLKFSKTKIVYNMWSNVNSSLGIFIIQFLADFIVVEAEFQKKKFEKYNIDDKIRKIYTQIDPKTFSPAMALSKERARKNMGVSGDKFVVGFLGGAKSTKGFDKLVEIAFRLIHICKRKDIFFLIAGVSKNDDCYKVKKINEQLLLIQDNVKVYEWIEDKQSFYKAIDLFVSLSVSEGLPGVIREAMGFGVPIIATNVGGTEEVLGNDKFLIDKTNREDIINEAIRLINIILKDYSTALIDAKTKIDRANELFIGDVWIKKLEEVFLLLIN